MPMPTPSTEELKVASNSSSGQPPRSTSLNPPTTGLTTTPTHSDFPTTSTLRFITTDLFCREPKRSGNTSGYRTSPPTPPTQEMPSPDSHLQTELPPSSLLLEPPSLLSTSLRAQLLDTSSRLLRLELPPKIPSLCGLKTQARVSSL